MKKITSLFVLLIIASVAFAQQPANLRVHGYPVYGQSSLRIPKFQRLRNQDFDMVLDYDAADAQNYNQGEYLSFIWTSNQHYSLAAHDPIDSGSMKYCIVAYDTLVDANTLETQARSWVVSNMIVDTISVAVGQVNHSGNPDTITVSIISLNGGATLWSTNIITDTGLSINGTGFHSWVYSYGLTVPANFTLPNNANTFGVKLEYFGDKRDTFGFLAGYGDPNLEGCGQGTTKASPTAYPNSYAYWVSQSSLLPNAQGGDIYYDCNQNGMYDAGSDGVNYIQNIRMLASVTFTSNLGVNDLKGNATLLNVYPNPSKDQSKISYSIQSSTNVTINIYDVTGKMVQSISKGKVAPGKYIQAVDLSTMAPGIYSFSINTTEGKSFGKIAVTR